MDFTKEREKISRLENKISKLEDNLEITKERLRKLKPREPMIYENTSYDSKKKELIVSYEYFCPYCGEQLYKVKRAAISKHKCGQNIKWK